jgi:hypothetical protein
MNSGQPAGLKLTEEEAFALLGLCLTSPTGLDAVSEKALRKLAEYCTASSNTNGNHIHIDTHSYCAARELKEAGA